MHVLVTTPTRYAKSQVKPFPYRRLHCVPGRGGDWRRQGWWAEGREEQGWRTQDWEQAAEPEQGWRTQDWEQAAQPEQGWRAQDWEQAAQPEHGCGS